MMKGGGDSGWIGEADDMQDKDAERGERQLERVRERGRERRRQKN